MIDVKVSVLFTNVLTYLFAYLFMATLIGFFHAWIANKMGDSTAEEQGFLTLNPVAHIDPVGFLCLLIFSFGWGKRVPVNPFNFYGRGRFVKLAIAYYAGMFMRLVLSAVVMGLLIWWFDPRIVIEVFRSLGRNVFDHAPMGQLYPTYSTTSLVFGFIGVAFVGLNMALAVIDFVVESGMLLLYVFTDDPFSYMQYSIYFTLLLPLVVILLFFNYLFFIVAKVVTYLGFLLAHLIDLW